MAIFERKYLEVKDETNASVYLGCYETAAKGQTVLIVGGFAAFPGAWAQMLLLLPSNYHYVGIDLKGFGNSSMEVYERLSPRSQAVLIRQAILKLDLNNLVMIGHSLGVTAGVTALEDPEIKSRLKRLVLISGIGIGPHEEQPFFTTRISSLSEDNPLLKFDSPEVTAYLFLRYLYFAEDRISRQTLSIYGEYFRMPGARECLVAAVQQKQIEDRDRFRRLLWAVEVPTLIIHGANDRATRQSDADFLKENIPDSRLEVLSDCGHLPQEEYPETTARLIADFIKEDIVQPESRQTMPRPVYSRLNMRRLIDRWSPGTMMIYFFVKILQLLKKMGMRAEENGWRKATGIFLRNEYSKFVLGAFRLRYYDNTVPSNEHTARQQLISRLADFLRRSSSVHWSVEPGFFQLGRRKLHFTDIVEAFWDDKGRLVKLEAHLDMSRNYFSILDESHIRKALDKLVKVYNKNLNINVLKRPTVVSRKMRRWAVRGAKGVGFTGRLELRGLVDRLLTATFIHCETLSDEKNLFLRRRLATPNIKIYRHPGWGLLNIICRFTPDYSEADLWLQYHHVPVDGMPMQELLKQLKNDWGSCGPIHYPALGSSDARPEMFYYGNNLFRARVYLGFESILAIRKRMNELYFSRMGGQATMAGMLIWGLAQHPAFADSKVVFPVDLLEDSGRISERELSLVFIRPGQYRDARNPIAGFIRFQKEFNWRVWRTRAGRSESYELLELYSMIHPLFYYIARYVFPKATGEILGTVGLTVIRDAEMFISPLSDLQQNGFMSIGNLAVPTVDGGTAGVVSICGDRKQLRHYIEAITMMAENYHEFLGIPKPVLPEKHPEQEESL
jgi:pimeloyl-ACP methyl ester carboxylesterase